MEKIDFVILDNDNSKALNYSFGHIVGDQVLLTAAERLTAAFFQGDFIARIDGDEFALLIVDWNTSAWNKICLKLRSVHTALRDTFPQFLELSITLNVGLSFSDIGYHQTLYQFADEGLYEAKHLGRTRCTLIGPGEILNHWKDETLSLLAKNVECYR